MSRWPPDAAARLKAGALRLFTERGFAAVTAAEIAASAGMTERTFFRHFKAKEDVLFEDYTGALEAVAAAMAAAPENASDRELMQSVADALGDRFESMREELRVFASVVGKEPTLRARELLRDHDWGQAIAEGFRRRGMPRARAALLAAVTGTTFRLVYDDWLRDHAKTKLATRFAAAVTELAERLRS